MKYLAITLFSQSTVTMNSANTANNSEQFDIGEISRVWLQLTATGTSSTTDISVQFQVSNDPMSLVSGNSTWINEGTAATFSGTAAFDKHTDLSAQKARVQLSRNAGAAVMTIRASGKE